MPTGWDFRDPSSWFIYAFVIMYRMNINVGSVDGISILKIWKLRLPWYSNGFPFPFKFFRVFKVLVELVICLFFSLYQIQDEDLVSDTNQGGSSSSLSTLDGQDKQSECQTSSQPLDKVFQCIPLFWLVRYWERGLYLFCCFMACGWSFLLLFSKIFFG